MHWSYPFLTKEKDSWIQFLSVLHSLLPECFPLFKIIDPIQCSPGQALLWTRSCYHWRVWIFMANISCSLSSMQNRGLPGIPCGEVAWPRIGSHWIMTMMRRWRWQCSLQGTCYQATLWNKYNTLLWWQLWKQRWQPRFAIWLWSWQWGFCHVLRNANKWSEQNCLTQVTEMMGWWSLTWMSTKLCRKRLSTANFPD